MRLTRSIAMSALIAAMLLAGVARAAQPDAGLSAPASATASLPAPVDDDVLAQIRGGFDLGNGMLASFGISRMVYINGNLVAGARVDIPDLSKIDSAQASQLAALIGSVTLIRNGPGNFIDPAAFSQAAGAIVIQNTLNNQQIQALTTLDLAVRNLGRFNSMNLADSLQQALIRSRGGM